MDSTGSTFISYRRGDAAGQAGRLYDGLNARLGPGHVFMDVDSIGFGLDYEKVIRDAVAGCELLLAVIGDGWIDARDERGARRLDDAADFVRVEIEAALEREIRVVPILINGAKLPEPAELPESLRPLARRQAVRLDDETFRPDMDRLIEQIERALTPAPTATPSVREERPAPTARAPWTADVLERKPATLRVVRVNLSRESHVVAVRKPPVTRDTVVVDGIQVAQGIDLSLSPVNFQLADGGATRLGVCDIKTNWFGGIDTVTLWVDDRKVYSG
jgi:TIR domain